jgi:phosphotransacetylase/acyl dehydratase
MLENKTFDEISIGDAASLTWTLRKEDLETWAAVTGDRNLMRVFDFAARQGPGGEAAAGNSMWVAGLFGTIVGNQLPGVGSVVRSASLSSERPLAYGTSVTATVTVTSKDAAQGIVTLQCRCADDRGTEYVKGTVEVVAPKQKVREPLRELPTVQVRREDRYLELLRRCEGIAPANTAVVHPCSDDALAGPIQAAERGLINPILVGPPAKIQSIAERAELDISPYTLVPVDHSHQAAERGVAMVRAGEAELLMKGSLHTDELLHEVLRRDTGIRTERRLSHCFLVAVPTYARPFILTDAAINIAPDLMAKRDICRNAIDIAHAMGLKEPKVAILAAVETINPAMQATIDAASLCKMADRGQIKGAILDGPLAFDNAADEEAARTKGIVSPVAGKADILVVPDLEAGNMLAKQLTFMANAEAAGIVAGARVPIILTSRADSVHTRMASCAVAALLADAVRKGMAGLKDGD